MEGGLRQRFPRASQRAGQIKKRGRVHTALRAVPLDEDRKGSLPRYRPPSSRRIIGIINVASPTAGLHTLEKHQVLRVQVALKCFVV